MPSIYPDKTWYLEQSALKGVTGRCPYANVLRCPRHHHSTALLSDEGVTTRLPAHLDQAATAKWRNHELFPATTETAASVVNKRMYLNFCPEVAHDTFKLFATRLISLPEEDWDRAAHEQSIRRDPGQRGKDWRTAWQDVEPLHYTNCALYAQLSLEKPVSNINFNGPVTGNVNVAGQDVNATTLSLSVSEILARIDASTAPPAEKEAAKSKLAAFLSHPLVVAVAGRLAGGAIGA